MLAGLRCPRLPAHLLTPPTRRAHHIDLRRVRDNQQYKLQNAKLRNVKANVPLVVDLYERVSKGKDALYRMRAERNVLSASRSRTPDALLEGKRLKEQIAAAEVDLARIQAELDEAALLLPCDSHPAAPLGDESQARVVYTHGAKPAFGFAPLLSHEVLGERLGLFDAGAGRAVAGAGFVVLTGDGVLLEAALVQWALEHARRAGFRLVAPPDVALTELVRGCGFNPRSEGGAASQVFSLTDSALSLIGTSEISVAGLHAGAILEPPQLPALYAAVSHCFRREAGGGGARDRGLYRLHQFTKVELFAFVAPEPLPAAGPDASHGEAESAATPAGSTADSSGGPLPPSRFVDGALDALVRLQMRMYAELGLHFRVLDMPTEELGAAAYRKFDIEAWMPCRVAAASAPVGSSASSGADAAAAAATAPQLRGAFGEISSASNCADYQARRLNIRYRHAPKDNRFVHTLNATACAIPRVMLALLETHQQADGSVRIPACLQKYMGGRTVLEPPGPAAGRGEPVRQEDGSDPAGSRVLLPLSELYDLPPGVVLS